MSILRYTASLDNTITNAFEENLSTRGTGSNMGASDILEVFSIYGQESTDSVELSRILIKFPMEQITADRDAKILPAKDSVTWKLKLYNARHFQTTPSSFDLKISAISANWEEGLGLDMEAYSDLTNDDVGSNWVNAKKRTSATATIVASTPGSLNNAATFTLTNAAGTTTTYRINGGGNHETQTGGTAGETIDVFIQFASTVAHIAEAITKAINATTNADMTATNDGTNITVTQTTKGTAGNKTNTDNSTGLTSVGNFTGATGQWSSAGGDYHASPSYSPSFDTGLENLDFDVTALVEQWLDSTKTNYGFGIKMSDAVEASSNSYYTKKFFGRGTEFYFKRPVLEAQFEDTIRDDRSNFYISSSLLPSADNLNCLYFYNKFRGRLVDIANDSSNLPVLEFYYSSGSVPEGDARGFQDQTGSATTFLTASRVSTGTYKVQVAVTSSIITDTYPFLVDVWSFGGEQVFTGSVISPETYKPETYEESSNFVLSMTNLKPEYGRADHPKLRLYAREKNWSPNIYNVAKAKPENQIISSGSYKVIRVVDDLTVVDYGTGSLKYTELSYDQNGNYFEFNMNMLEPGYQYGFKFAIYDDYTKSYLEQPYLFKFRVV